MMAIPVVIRRLWPLDSRHRGRFQPRSVSAEFLAQALHVGVERAAVGGVAVAPDGAQQVVAVLGFSGALAEEEQQLELGGGEFDRFVVEVELERVLVEAERAVGEIDRAGRGFRAFEDGLDPQHEFLRAEGLGEVVVGPGFESLDAVLGLGAGGEHDDRDVDGAGVAAEVAEDGVAVPPGQHEVEHDQVRALAQGDLRACDAVVRLEDLDSPPVGG